MADDRHIGKCLKFYNSRTNGPIWTLGSLAVVSVVAARQLTVIQWEARAEECRQPTMGHYKSRTRELFSGAGSATFSRLSWNKGREMLVSSLLCGSSD